LPDMPTLQVDALRRLTRQVFEACRSPAPEAAIVAEHLVTSSLMGVDSHGLMRIPEYVREIREGGIRPGSPITVVKETETTATVDCAWNFGQVGATRAIQTAIEKARARHSSCVITRRCGHIGRLGAYVDLAARQGYLALGVCSSPRHGHFVLPWGGREARLATNPVAFGIPANSGLPVIADFSTSATPEGKIRLYRDQGKKLPEGWIVDGSGVPSTNPADFYGPPMGAILPFGREAGYRGFALSLLVEVLSATLSGQDITIDRPGNGVGFIVVDVSAFLPMEQFCQLIEGLRGYIKSSAPAEGFDEVLLPGEPEFRTAKVRQETGIPLDDTTWRAILAAAESVGVNWCGEDPSQNSC
jgi:hydroxycarboxylate dehydrogenase B